MEERRVPLTSGDLLNPAQPRHGEAWDRLRQICVDYNLDPPTLPGLATESAAPAGFTGQHGGDVGLWLMYEALPALGVGYNQDIDQLVMMPTGGIVNLEGGYFIRLPSSPT